MSQLNCSSYLLQNSVDCTELEMKLNETNQENLMVETIAVSVSFFVTIVIGISVSINLCHQLLVRQLFRKTFYFRYLLQTKIVSDILVLFSAIVLFSIEEFMELSPIHPPSFHALLDVYSQIKDGAMFVSSLMTFLYCGLKLRKIAPQRNDSEFATNFVLAFILLVFLVAVINVFVFTTRRFTSLPLFTSVMLWADLVTLLVLLVPFITFFAWKIICSQLFLYQNNTKINTTGNRRYEDDVTTVLVVNDVIPIKCKREKFKLRSETCNYRKLTPRNPRITLFLFLFGVVFISFLLNCIFLLQKTSSLYIKEAVVTSFFSTISLIMVTMAK